MMGSAVVTLPSSSSGTKPQYLVPVRLLTISIAILLASYAPLGRETFQTLRLTVSAPAIRMAISNGIIP